MEFAFTSLVSVKGASSAAASRGFAAYLISRKMGGRVAAPFGFVQRRL
jgi:hypothetical protein